jgi:hypothetical protein
MPGVECRKFGPTKLVFTFNTDVQVMPGLPAAILSAGTVESVAIAGPQLTITLSGVPDESCLTIWLYGISDSAGRPLAGDSTVQLIALKGDTNSDGLVDIRDVDVVKAHQSLFVWHPENFRCDVDLDGKVLSSDIVAVKVCEGHAAPCVTDPGPWLYSAVSRKAQGSYPYLDLPLLLDPSSGVAVECRNGGPTEIQLRFSEPVEAIDGTLDATEITISAGSVTGVALVGPDWLSVTLSNVPNGTCLVVTPTGLADMYGHLLTMPSSVTVGVLFADVNSSLAVDQTDVSAITAAVGQSISGGPHYYLLDLNLDGIIDSTDVALAQNAALNGQPLVCP